MPGSSILLLVLLVPFIFWLWRNERRKPIRLFHSLVTDGQSGFLTARLVAEKVPALSGPNARFRGVWWLPGGNAQTIYSSMGDFSQMDPVTYERKYLQLADEGLLAVDILPPLSSHPANEHERVVLVAHGLTGGSHASYIRATVTALAASASAGGLGFRAVVINFRGCNGSPVITPKLYHAGCSDDVRPVILWICNTFPRSRIFGLGFSLGANVLTKYAGEEGNDCPLDGLVSLANVWDFVEGNKHIERGTLMNRLVYHNVLGGALRSLLYLHRHAFLSVPSSQLSHTLLKEFFAKRTVTLKEYDTMITIPLYGFKHALDYYEQISSSRFVDNIKIPCLGINSLDDPMIGQTTLPLAQVARNPWVVLAATPGGGHLGWFQQNPDGSLGRWYIDPIKQFFSALLDSDLPPRPRPGRYVDNDGMTRQQGKPDIAFIERDSDFIRDIATSGTGQSTLFTGW